MKCDHDCFHCRYPDCIDRSNISSEIRDINDALFGWDFEIRRNRITALLKMGYSPHWIKAALDLTDGEYHACAKGIKRTAKRTQTA